MSEDWRILPWHAARFTGLTLRWRPWVPAPGDDHDHCAFCWDKFAALEGCLRAGYCTADGRDWVCETCFRDFRGRFRWEVAPDERIPRDEI